MFIYIYIYIYIYIIFIVTLMSKMLRNYLVYTVYRYGFRVINFFMLAIQTISIITNEKFLNYFKLRFTIVIYKKWTASME